MSACNSEEITPDRINKKGLVVKPGGRPSVKKLAKNAWYSTSYRNPLDMLEIMGKKLTIGNACALLGIAHFGPNIPLEEAGHEDRLRMFKEAAYYALTDEELDDILNTDDAALRLFFVGIFRVQCRLIKFVGPAGVREEFEHCVFHPPSKDAVIQAHLGLSMAESIFDQ